MSETNHIDAIKRAVLDTLTTLGIGEGHDPADTEVTLDGEDLVIRVTLSDDENAYTIEDGNIVAAQREFSGTITATVQVFVTVRATSPDEAEDLLSTAAWDLKVDASYIDGEDIDVEGDDIADIEVDVR